jgi:hypothetical protein
MIMTSTPTTTIPHAYLQPQLKRTNTIAQWKPVRSNADKPRVWHQLTRPTVAKPMQLQANQRDIITSSAAKNSMLTRSSI